MPIEPYIAIPGEPSSFSLMVSGLITIGVYLVVSGKLRAMRTAAASQLASEITLPVDSQPPIADQLDEDTPAGVLDTIQSAIDVLRGEARGEQTEQMERELRVCLDAAEAKMAEVDSQVVGSDVSVTSIPRKQSEPVTEGIASQR